MGLMYSFDVEQISVRHRINLPAQSTERLAEIGKAHSLSDQLSTAESIGEGLRLMFQRAIKTTMMIKVEVDVEKNSTIELSVTSLDELTHITMMLDIILNS